MRTCEEIAFWFSNRSEECSPGRQIREAQQVKSSVAIDKEQFVYCSEDCLVLLIGPYFPCLEAQAPRGPRVLTDLPFGEGRACSRHLRQPAPFHTRRQARFYPPRRRVAVCSELSIRHPDFRMGAAAGKGGEPKATRAEAGGRRLCLRRDRAYGGGGAGLPPARRVVSRRRRLVRVWVCRLTSHATLPRASIAVPWPCRLWLRVLLVSAGAGRVTT